MVKMKMVKKGKLNEKTLLTAFVLLGMLFAGYLYAQDGNAGAPIVVA